MFLEKIFGQPKKSRAKHHFLTADTDLIFDNRNVSPQSEWESDYEIRDCLIFDRASIINKKGNKKIQRAPSVKNVDLKSRAFLDSRNETRRDGLLFQNVRCNVESSVTYSVKSSTLPARKCKCDVCNHIAFERLKSRCYGESIQIAQEFCSCCCQDCESRKRMVVQDEKKGDNVKEELENKIKTMEHILALKLQVDTMRLLLSNQSCPSVQSNEEGPRKIESVMQQRNEIPNSKSCLISQSDFYSQTKSEKNKSVCLKLSDVLDQNLVEKCMTIRHLKRELENLVKITSEDDTVFKAMLQERLHKLEPGQNSCGSRWAQIDHYIRQLKSFDEKDQQVLLIIWEQMKTELKS